MSSPQGYPSSSSNFRRSSPAPNHAPPAAQPRRLDPLALDDDEDDQNRGMDDGMDGNEEDPAAAARRGARRRLRGGLMDEIPSVKDQTGEAVMQSFQDFLET